jgi:hypothetical protein
MSINGHVEMYMQFSQRYCEAGEAFLQQMVTGDETWVHHYEPGSKCENIQQKHVSSSRTKKLKKCAF